jgi:hypothetical protein
MRGERSPNFYFPVCIPLFRLLKIGDRRGRVLKGGEGHVLGN